MPSAFSHLYTLLFVLIGWLIFYFKPAEGGFESLLLYFGGMFGFLSLPLVNKELGYALVRNFLFLVMLCVGCTPYPKKLFFNLKEKAGLKNIKFVCDLAFDVVLLMVFVLCVAYVTSSDYRPNIYFEF